MGHSQSKEQSPTARPVEEDQFMEKPWRTVKGWGKSTRDEMKSKMEEFDPRPFGVPTFNVILTGQVGSGRSSFFNSVYSIFNEMVCTTKATAGEMAAIVTKEFKIYELKNTYFRIWDTRGIEAFTSEADIRNILKVVDGHVPNGHKFDLDKEFLSSSPGYIPSPKLAERAHCVALVINAEDISRMRSDIVHKLQILTEALINRDLPIVIILTHLDEFLPEVEEDITKTFHSRRLEELVNKVHNMVHGLPEGQIFPIINYCKACDLDDNMDILLLYALRCIIAAAEAYLQKVNDQQS